MMQEETCLRKHSDMTSGENCREENAAMVMTLENVRREGAARLEQAGVEESDLDAWLLLEHVTGISRAEFLADRDRPMEKEHAARYFSLIRQRADRIPLQHLTGVQEFMGLEFQVNEHVLIPRQDTEILAETALTVLSDREGLQILDLCTGSGCILLSILFYMEKSGNRVLGTGADISPKALEVAQRNAEKLRVRANFIQSDLFSDVEEAYDIIVSNPPYIRTAEIDTLQDEVRFYDPHLALDGGTDGLDFYRRIVKECPAYLTKGGSLLMEIGSDQAEAVSELMLRAGFQNVTVEKDLAGLDRVVHGVYDK